MEVVAIPGRDERVRRRRMRSSVDQQEPIVADGANAREFERQNRRLPAVADGVIAALAADERDDLVDRGQISVENDALAGQPDASLDSHASPTAYEFFARASPRRLISSSDRS